MRKDTNGDSAAGLDAVRLLQLPGNSDGPRKLTFVEPHSSCPFEIRRVYWLHNLDDGEVRGHHSHKELSQLLISVSGAFDVDLDDGFAKRTYRLDSPAIALLVPPMVWRVIRAIRSQSTLVALASAPYDESDYIRVYSEFVRLVQIPRER